MSEKSEILQVPVFDVWQSNKNTFDFRKIREMGFSGKFSDFPGDLLETPSEELFFFSDDPPFFFFYFEAHNPSFILRPLPVRYPQKWGSYEFSKLKFRFFGTRGGRKLRVPSFFQRRPQVFIFLISSSPSEISFEV